MKGVSIRSFGDGSLETGLEGLPREIRIGSVFEIAVSPSDTVGWLRHEAPITRQLCFRDSGALKSTVALKICGASSTWHAWICVL
jgi:hypothetical protein